MKKISALIITHNERENIRRCLEPLIQLCEEVVVIDSFSKDGTVEICKEMGVRIIQTNWRGYAATKNYGNSLCENDWILSIDADEVLTEELIENIQNLKLDENHIYSLDRLTSFCGQWIKYSGWYPDWKVRIFNRKNVKWRGDFVHETLDIPSGFTLTRLKGKLHHYSYKNLDDHWQRNEKYAILSAEDLYARGRRASFVKLWLSPPFRFFRTFIIKGGFLDGKYGYIISKRDAYLVWKRYRVLRDMQQQKKFI